MRLSVIISNILSCLSVGKLMWKRYSMIVFCICTWSFSKDIFHFKMKSTFIGFVSQIFVLCLLKNDEISVLRAFHMSCRFCWIMYYDALVYCFTTYSFSKIHRHISTCILDWRFKAKKYNVKQYYIVKEIDIKRAITRYIFAQNLLEIL